MSLERARRRFAANHRRAFRDHDRQLRLEASAKNLRHNGHPLAARRDEREAERCKVRAQRNHARALHWEAIVRKLEAEAPHGPVVMFDSVTVSEIPKGAPAVAGYVGGLYPTFTTLLRDFPDAKKLSIAISASEDADCLDVETGDATAAQCPAWFVRQRQRNLAVPTFYGSVQGSVPAMLHELAWAGIARHEFKLWTAHLTYHPHICGPDSCGALIETHADATQWTFSALGRNLDESRCSKSFL